MHRHKLVEETRKYSDIFLSEANISGTHTFGCYSTPLRRSTSITILYLYLSQSLIYNETSRLQTSYASFASAFISWLNASERCAICYWAAISRRTRDKSLDSRYRGGIVTPEERINHSAIRYLLRTLRIVFVNIERRKSCFILATDLSFLT